MYHVVTEYGIRYQEYQSFELHLTLLLYLLSVTLRLIFYWERKEATLVMYTLYRYTLSQSHSDVLCILSAPQCKYCPQRGEGRQSGLAVYTETCPWSR